MKSIILARQVLSALSHSAKYSNVHRAKMSAAIYETLNIDFAQHNVRIDGSKFCWTIHAEERLLTKTKCAGLTVVVYRLNGDGTSKPCAKCSYLLKDAAVKRVIFNMQGSWFVASPLELIR